MGYNTIQDMIARRIRMGKKFIFIIQGEYEVTKEMSAVDAREMLQNRLDELEQVRSNADGVDHSANRTTITLFEEK